MLSILQELPVKISPVVGLKDSVEEAFKSASVKTFSLSGVKRAMHLYLIETRSAQLQLGLFEPNGLHVEELIYSMMCWPVKESLSPESQPLEEKRADLHHIKVCSWCGTAKSVQMRCVRGEAAALCALWMRVRRSGFSKGALDTRVEGAMTVLLKKYFLLCGSETAAKCARWVRGWRIG